jgi:hypothetical protein
MTRALKIPTLNQAARDYAGMWLRPDQKSRSGAVFVDGPSRVLQDLYGAFYKDEYEYLVTHMKEWMGPATIGEFEKRGAQVFTPRDDKVFASYLRTYLAIDPDGNHVPGVVGRVQIGQRAVGHESQVVRTSTGLAVILPRTLYWPVYAGEEEERRLGSRAVDPLPYGAEPWPLSTLMATNPNISAAAAIVMIDALAALFDVGSPAGLIQGYSGSQPADPDAAATGTKLFELVMNGTAFGAGADVAPGGRVTANAITDDSSADDTGTLGYCRIGDAAELGILDGEAGTSGADFNFNTLSIVAGAVVSMSSLTVTMPQGATAT